MGWITEVFEDRVRSRSETKPANEQQFEEAAAQRWRDLLAQLKSDVNEYNQQGGNADFSKDSETECHITDADTGLTLRLWADIGGHMIHYSFESKAARVASPEGGIFSMRPSRWGRAELYSSDQHVNSEAARRMLLEPLLFPTESAA